MSLFETRDKYENGIISKPQYIDEMHDLHAHLFEYSEFIRDTDITSIEISDGLVIMTSRTTGVKIICDKEDKRIAPIEILNFSFYEKADSDLIFRMIDPGFNVFDIGANIGWYALNMVKLFNDINVYAFEPIPTTFTYLKRNIEINRVQNVYPYNFGFSNQTGDLVFYFYPEGSVNASSANLSERGNVREITCSVKRFDDFVTDAGLRVDFIKCDVEGAEIFVYRGGMESIKHYKPIIFTEMLRKWAAKFSYHPNEIIELLGSIGYRCFTAKGENLSEFFSMDESTVETNFFFLHSIKHASKINSLIGVA